MFYDACGACMCMVYVPRGCMYTRQVAAPHANDIIWENLPLNPDGRIAPLLFTVCTAQAHACMPAHIECM